MQDDSMVNQGEMTSKNKNMVIENVFVDSEMDENEMEPDVVAPNMDRLETLPNIEPVVENESPQIISGQNFNGNVSDTVYMTNIAAVAERDQNKDRLLEENRTVEHSEEELDTCFCGSPSTSIITNDDEKAAEANNDIGSEDERESFHIRYSDIFNNWEYSEDERKWLRYKVETLTRNQCVVFCILGHIILSQDEMPGIRYAAPNPEDARQALLSLCLGSQWDVFNLAILMAFNDKVNMVERYTSTMFVTNAYKARGLIKYMLLKIL